PDLTQTVKEAELAYRSAQAAFDNRKAELQSSLLSQEANVATIEAQYKQAAMELEANETLFKENLVPELTVKQKRSTADDLKNRLAVERNRLKITQEGMTSQLAPQEADVNQKKSSWDLSRQKLEDLKV